MKLLSARARNYRVHRDVMVDFDAARTLIGGPNESGKSTFIEAVHRGLFLKARVTGSVQKEMVSDLHSGHPEVEVEFEASGGTYRVVKRFSGSSGTAQLVEVGGKSWQGEEAESRLHDLLKVDELPGGRGVAGRVIQQWAHLWVWQGKSGQDPSVDAASEQTRLLRRLQEVGGAAAMQSDRDARIAGRFAAWCERVFTQAGKPKAGSDLDGAIQELHNAQTAKEEAQARLNRLIQAVTDFESANATITRCEADLENLEQQRKEVAERLQAVARLKAAEERQANETTRAVEKFQDLKEASDHIEGLRRVVLDLEKSLAPKSEQGAKLQDRCQHLQLQVRACTKAYEAALEASRGIRQRRELARAWLEQFDSAERQRALSGRHKQVLGLRGEVRTLREELAQLPELDQEGWNDLQKARNQADQAGAALKAMAAGIEVVAADLSVRVGEKPMKAGDAQVVTETTDVFVGDGVRLRVQPGGGGGLSEARDTVRGLLKSLADQLEALGLKSLEHGAEVLAKRQGLKTRLEKVESRLDHLDPGNLEKELAEAGEALKAAEAEVSRRSEQSPACEPPADRDAGSAWLEREESALENAESAEQEHKAAVDSAREKLETAEASLREFNSELEEQRGVLNQKTAELRVLLTSHGDDEARAVLLRDAGARKKKAEAALDETRRQLEQLQPAQLERDRDRLERAMQAKQDEKNRSMETRASNRAELRLDGSQDPQAELARANARLETARDHHDSVARKADAMKLLHQMFQEQQKVLADQFTRPLADRISEYLKGLFGAEARAVVTFGEGVRMELVRPGQPGAEAFHRLSGGTKEQVAAAVRLAMAEVLVADHDGCLPIVFDDAFAYSDPDRVQTLQRMLDLAASKGLQVIVLTCNPSDYAALGARQVRFSRPTTTAAMSATPTAGGKDPLTPGSEQKKQETGDDAMEADPAADQREFLLKLGEKDGKSGNKALQNVLGWTDDRYARIKASLMADGKVVPGQGRGGSVRLKPQP